MTSRISSATPYGPQYPGDDCFKAAARLHQSRFRVEQLGITDYRVYGNRLPPDAARQGSNFYPWPGLLEAVKKRFGLGDKKLYWDMLGSDHVPFNLFVPLRDIEATENLVASWTGDGVRRVTKIEVEWAPSPKKYYLNDNTSFDAYLECERTNGGRGAVGVEVKYTERQYSWGKRERAQMFDPASPYHRVHAESGWFIEGAIPKLATPSLKQFWRNQLLGAAMLQRHPGGIENFTSVLLYPAGNTHFASAATEYAGLLRPEARHRFVAVTYEEFVAQCRRAEETPRTKHWLDYLERRYIVSGT